MSKLHLKQASFFISLVAIPVILAGLSPKGASAFAPAGFTDTPTPTDPIVVPDSTPTPTPTDTTPPPPSRERKPKATPTRVLLPVTGEVPPDSPWAFFSSLGPLVLLAAVLFGILVGFVLGVGPRKSLLKKLGFLSRQE